MPVLADPRTLTLEPTAAMTARTARTRAVIACHLHGVCADVPAIRQLLPGVAVIEDVAQGLGSRLDGLLAGTMGDAAVLSLGPGKQLDAGEGGVLLCHGADRHHRAVAMACHPLRQLLTGLPDPDPAALAIRPHPVTAVLALHQLSGWSETAARFRYTQVARRLAGHPGVRLLAGIGRRGLSQPQVPCCCARRIPARHRACAGRGRARRCCPARLPLPASLLTSCWPGSAWPHWPGRNRRPQFSRGVQKVPDRSKNPECPIHEYF